MDCELQVATQVFICGCPPHSAMPVMLNMKLLSIEAFFFFFKEMNRLLFPMWTEAGRPHLTYKIQTIVLLCLGLLLFFLKNEIR